MKRISLVLIPVAATIALATGVVLAQPHGPGHGPGHPPCAAEGPSAEHHQEMLAHVAKLLGLSDAQLAAVEQLHAQRRPTLEPLFARQAKLHAEVEAALDQGASAATVGNLVIAAHKVRKELKAVHADLQREAEAILDAGQVKKLRALMAQHGH